MPGEAITSRSTSSFGRKTDDKMIANVKKMIAGNVKNPTVPKGVKINMSKSMAKK